MNDIRGNDARVWILQSCVDNRRDYIILDVDNIAVNFDVYSFVIRYWERLADRIGI